ncbi:MAG: SDR family oxidoreductase, partial [Pseudomonadota bacterium]
GMTLPLARELTRFGIRVMTIAPGVFHTPMIDTLPEDIQQALGNSVPFPKRLGRPEEFADCCIHIVENAYLNGSTIRLDGATRLEPQ